MKNKNGFKKLARQNNELFWGGILSTVLGETKYVKTNDVLKTVNTAVGLVITGRSIYNAFKMLDYFDDAEEDVKNMSTHLAKEFVLAPIANCTMLAYSSASEESKKRIKNKLIRRY